VESLHAFERIVQQYPDEDYLIRTAAQIALIVDQPARAADWMVKLRPELAGADAAVTLLNCESAIIPASAWQRMNRQQDAQRLLRRTAAWIDHPRVRQGSSQPGYSLREARLRGVSAGSAAGAVRARRLVSSAIFSS
jgi:hypothetical protein